MVSRKNTDTIFQALTEFGTDSLKKRGRVTRQRNSDTFQVGVLGTHLGSCLSLHKTQILFTAFFWLHAWLHVVLGYSVSLVSFPAQCFYSRKHFCIEFFRRTSFGLLVKKNVVLGEKPLLHYLFLKP